MKLLSGECHNTSLILKSTLVQVMVWCRQATNHYLSQCWPRFLSPYDVTRPQWVNRYHHSWAAVTPVEYESDSKNLTGICTKSKISWTEKSVNKALVTLTVQSFAYTVETLYSTIYYSKYFIELNFDKSTQYVALWTHKRHPIPRPFGRAMECLLWVLQQKLTML